MGVPGLFRIIIEKHKNSYMRSSNLETEIDNFFIDFNAMIYNAYSLFDKELNNNLKLWEIENIIIEEVIRYTKYLITEIVKPKKLVYISIDGSAPLSKMIQQRSRRYKSVLEEGYQKYLKKKYNLKTKSNKFDKCSISPGSEFMYRLSEKLKINIKNKNIFQGLNLKKIILSDSTVPGEGEHKFIPYLKKISDTEKHVIFSPDADMIILSILSNQNNIYILKQYSDFQDIIKFDQDDPPDFIYLDINFCKEKFLESLVNEYKDNLENSKNILQDWVFLTILSGNDFVIPLPFLKINKNNIKLMPQLTKYYKIIKQELGEFLISNNKINITFLKQLINYIASIEHGYYKKILKNIHRVRKEGNKKAEEKEENMDEYQIDLNRFYHREFFDDKNPFYNTYNKEFDKINYFQENWEEQYYCYYFGENNEKLKQKICEEYFKILQWNLEYYLNNIPPCWNFYYKYRMPPLFKDFYNYIINNDNLYFVFEKDKPIDPLKQLMLILPQKSSNIMPKVLRDQLNKNEFNFYQDKFSLEVLSGHKYIYSDPILPDFKHEIVKEIYDKNINKISKKESLRNKINHPFIFNL